MFGVTERSIGPRRHDNTIVGDEDKDGGDRGDNGSNSDGDNDNDDDTNPNGDHAVKTNTKVRSHQEQQSFFQRLFFWKSKNSEKPLHGKDQLPPPSLLQVQSRSTYNILRRRPVMGQPKTTMSTTAATPSVTPSTASSYLSSAIQRDNNDHQQQQEEQQQQQQQEPMNGFNLSMISEKISVVVDELLATKNVRGTISAAVGVATLLGFCLFYSSQFPFLSLLGTVCIFIFYTLQRFEGSRKRSSHNGPFQEGSTECQIPQSELIHDEKGMDLSTETYTTTASNTTTMTGPSELKNQNTSDSSTNEGRDTKCKNTNEKNQKKEELSSSLRKVRNQNSVLDICGSSSSDGQNANYPKQQHKHDEKLNIKEEGDNNNQPIRSELPSPKNLTSVIRRTNDKNTNSAMPEHDSSSFSSSDDGLPLNQTGYISFIAESSTRSRWKDSEWIYAQYITGS